MDETTPWLKDSFLVEAFNLVRDRVSRSLSDDQQSQVEAAMYGAWITGGAHAMASLLDASEILRGAWGSGNDRKAISLLAVCSLAMISRWYRIVDSQMGLSDDERRQAREVSATNMLKFFDSHSPEAIRDFMNLDVQFNFDRDRQQHHYELDIRMRQAEQACDAQVNLDLGGVTFPITSYADVLTSRLRLWDEIEMLVLPLAFAEGEKETVRWLREYYIPALSE